jgi:hypothetical protein
MSATIVPSATSPNSFFFFGSVLWAYLKMSLAIRKENNVMELKRKQSLLANNAID